MNSNTIHPTAVVGPDVLLGSGNVIGPFVVLEGRIALGDDNRISAGVSIGMQPEVRGLLDQPTPDSEFDVIIGSGNIFREYVQIHRGLVEPTRVGDETYIMNQSYVAHDGDVGDRATLASSVLLAGHVKIGVASNLGMGTVVHQFRTIGSGAMVGMASVVTRDIPCFAKSYGSPSRVLGANSVGMGRMGIEQSVVADFSECYDDFAETAPPQSMLDQVREYLAPWEQS